MKKNKISSILALLFLLSFGQIRSANFPNTNSGTPVDILATSSLGYKFISEPGYYYLRENFVVDYAGSALYIKSDNVTLDLNGFAIIGEHEDASIGIFAEGYNNITIKNGKVENFGRGIYAFGVNQATFRDLIVKNNGNDGLITGYNALVINCVAFGNEQDGIDVRDGSIVQNCMTSFNGDDGIEMDPGGIIHNSTSHGNGSHGINASEGSRIEACTVYDNAVYGLDLSKNTTCLNNMVYRNGWHGIHTSGNALIMNNVSNENGTCITNGTCGTGTGGQGSNINQGAGIIVSSNVKVINNQCNGNYFGIIGEYQDSEIIGNTVQNNRHAGIIGVSDGSLFIKNVAEGNGFEQAPSVTDTSEASGYPMGDIVFQTDALNYSSIGPIIDVSGGGDISTVSGATHPFANFVY